VTVILKQTETSKTFFMNKIRESVQEVALKLEERATTLNKKKQRSLNRRNENNFRSSITYSMNLQTLHWHE
jgi:hypothetical protein